MIRAIFSAGALCALLLTAAGPVRGQAPVSPSIGSVSPRSVSAGSGGFTLTVTGFLFNGGSIVTWNGAPLRTRFGGLTLLTADVPAALVATPGTVAVTASVPGFGSTTAVDFEVVPGLAQPQAPALSITTKKLADGMVGTPYSEAISAKGGSPPYRWSISAGVPPVGVSLGPQTGLLAGTPTQPGTFTFTIRVTDKEEATDTAVFSVNITAPLSIVTGSLPAGTVGTPYSQALAASGGIPPYTWNLAAGALPDGLALRADGILSGTPSAAGTFNFTVRVSDSASATATQALAITIASRLSVTTVSLPNASNGAPYSQTLGATGGAPPYTWSISAGALPPGLGLSTSGVLSGTPATTGSFNFTARVTDSTSATATQAFTLVVVAGPSITTISLPNGIVGVLYSQTLRATGGVPPYTWSISAGALPPGLGLSASGVLGGTASAAGSFSFTVRVADTTSAAGTQALTITINPALSITTGSLPNGFTGAVYSQTLGASGGAPPYTWSVAAGALPPGLALSAGGVLSGTPSAVGSFNFTAQVADSGSATATRGLTLVVIAGVSITTTSLPNGTAGAPYSQALGATGGAPPYTWSVAAGALPPGLALSAGGVLSGTPTAAGTFNFTARAADSASATATQALTLTVGAALSITTASLPNGAVGTAYTQTLAATGGAPPYTWSVAGGALPPGLALSAGGALSGTPGTAGNFSFTVKVADSGTAAATHAFTMNVASGLTISTTALPQGAVGTSYTQTLAAAGGVPPYTFSLSSGSLPPGLALNSSGAIGGTPNGTGTFGFSVQVTDSASGTATRQLSITITQALSILTASLPAATPGIAYSQALAVTGGVPPYSWSLASGALPPGLSLSVMGGTISGTPSAPGKFDFTVQVFDSGGANATKALSISVGSALSITTASALPSAGLGTPYSQPLAVTGGTAPYTWSVTQGALPPGISLGTSGTLSGTPSKAGTFNFVAQALDATGATAAQTFTLAVVTALTITSTSPLPAAVSGAAYSHALAALGGTAPYTWTITAGSLPAGLSLDATTGVITGTTTKSGTFSLTVQVADSAGSTTTKAFTLAVVSGLAITTESLPAATVGAAYSQTLAAVSGNPPYTWSIAAGTLPEGLQLNAPSGAITGTPTQTGSSQFTVKVTDSGSLAVTRSFTLAVAPPLAIGTEATLPGGTAGQPYSATLSATGGTTPYAWTVSSGNLPAGLTLDPAAGAIAGTPAAAGSFRFSVQVADSANRTATRALTLAIGTAPVPALTLDGLQATAGPLQQSQLSLTLKSAYALPITGQLTLSFQPDADLPIDDPGIQFSSGGRTADFTVAPNSTAAVFSSPGLAIQTGSVSGTITVTARLAAGGVDVTPSPAPQLTAKVDRSVPVIRAVKLVSTSAGFEVWITGYSPSRELTQAVFDFAPATGGNLQTMQVTLPLASAARAWYSDSASAPFGSQFTLVQPFTVQGSTGAIGSVSVTLSNAQGSSAAAVASFAP